VVYDVRVVHTTDAAVDAVTGPGFDYARSVVLEDLPSAVPAQVGEATVSVDGYTFFTGELVMTVHTSEPGVLVTSEPSTANAGPGWMAWRYRCSGRMWVLLQ